MLIWLKIISNPTSDTLSLDPNGTSYLKHLQKFQICYKGVIQIKSLIPGTEFKITEVSSNNFRWNRYYLVKGTYQSTATAVMGTGKAALEDARDALSRLVTGNQQSVYTTQDLYGPARFNNFYKRL
ncbi:hypothetical protein ACN2CX_09150 [Aliarcobacter butzleri]|uniref:hypothetical protein n=1 Tax=Aliarcobacter butzleri TaxID=28197 RepID=UPI003AFB2191